MKESTIPTTFDSHISISIISVLLLIVVMAALPVASATTTTIQPSSADSYLDAGNSNTNFGGKEIISVYPGGTKCTTTSNAEEISATPESGNRGIIEFDLLEIPAGAQIQDAKLGLYCVKAEGGARYIGVHRVQQDPARDWIEGYVTWDSYNRTHCWTTSGGDFNEEPMTCTVNQPEQWYSWDVTGDVQDFVAEPTTNFGWIIKDENQGSGKQKIFASKEWDTVSLRPILEVTYKLVVSCDEEGNEVNQFAPGEKVYVRAEGLEAKIVYGIWLQDDPVSEGDELIKEEHPGSAGTPMKVETDKEGNLRPTMIWDIPEDEPVTHHGYDIVFDKLGDSNEGKYNATSDGLDSASVAGIIAPTPDVSALVLFASGLMLAAVCFVYGKRREGDKK